MLPGRLTRVAVAVAAALTVSAACGSGDDGAIGDAVVKPGVTAVEQAGGLACAADAEALRTAAQAYEMLEGRPAVSEGALVAAGLLREPSEMWDVVDGQLVAESSACGDVGTGAAPTPTTVAAPELPTVEAMLGELSEAEIAEVGGYDCAYEVAEVSLAVGQWQIERGVPPASLTELIAAGRLTPPRLWTVTATALEPVAGSSCIGPIALLAPVASICESDLRALEAALEAFVATVGAPPESERLLIEAGLIETEVATYDLVGGEIVPADGSPCSAPAG